MDSSAYRYHDHLGSAACALLIAWLVTPGAVAAPAPAALEASFQKSTQALFDAIAAGDKDVWDRAMDAACIVTTEDGEVLDKAKFLLQFRPLPAGFLGRGDIRDLTVRAAGNSAVVNYRIDEHEDIHGRQELHTNYIETDTYLRRGTGWKMIAMQVTVVPRDLEPLATDTAEWAALEGDYRFPGEQGIRYRVFRRAERLFGGKDEKSATQLIPLAPRAYFQAGSIHLIIFVADASGAVNGLREIHKYNEVLMERVAPVASATPHSSP